jgi:uncharacterized protein YfaA (DUF2138 family)
MDDKKKRLLGYGLGLAFTAGLGLTINKFFPHIPEVPTKKEVVQQGPQKNAVPEDIDHLNAGKAADVVIVTQKFTSLWRDILKTSFFKKMINEDLLFYYEESEDLLSLKGAAKRIAFEHETTLMDEVLAYVLDRPMQVAFWKAYHGRLDHFMGVTTRSGLTDIMLAIAKVASSDQQLFITGKREVDGKQVEVYQLDYLQSRSIYFYQQGDEIVFFSNYNLPMLSKDLRQKLFKEKSDEVKEADTHTVFVSTSFVSFGYQFFSPELTSLRFAYNDRNGWETAITSAATLSTESLLKVIPAYPAFCSMVPFRTEKVERIFSLPPELKGKISEHVAVCWYEGSKLYTPLFVFKTQQDLKEEDLKELFVSVVGTFEKGLLTEEEAKKRAEQIEKLNSGEQLKEPIVRPKNFVKAFDVISEKGAKNWKISREISSPYGLYSAEESKNQNDMRSKKFFKVALAYHKDILVFSADDKLVDKTLSTLGKNFPNAKDMVSAEGSALFVFDPPRLAALLKEASLESLPEQEEQLFRESLSNRLFTSFKGLSDMKPVLGIVSEESKKQTWSEIEWRTYSSR